METVLLDNLADILECETDEIAMDTDFRQDEFDWDSLKGFAILVMLEEEFDVKMSVDEFLAAKTIGDIKDYVEAKS